MSISLSKQKNSFLVNNAKEAILLQLKLAKEIDLSVTTDKINIIAACDVSYSKSADYLWGAFIIFSYPDLKILESSGVRDRVSFPYIPGLLTFREAPILIKAYEQLTITPDLILFDGQGVAHPRRMGLATHMGLILNKPSIGVAKSRLIGSYGSLKDEVGAYTPLIYKNQQIGWVIRSRKRTKPIYISPGHKISMEQARKFILSLLDGRYKQPYPLRKAHLLVNHLRRKDGF